MFLSNPFLCNPQLYDSSGRTFPREQAVRELLTLNEKFVRLHPNFVGIKVIYAVWRGADAEKMRENVKEFRMLQ